MDGDLGVIRRRSRFFDDVYDLDHVYDFDDKAIKKRTSLPRIIVERGNLSCILLPYSPNLNLIERFWKFTKKKVLYSRYYETFVDFQNAITDLLDNAADKYADELDTLLTLKFQTFENIKSV